MAPTWFFLILVVLFGLVLILIAVVRQRRRRVAGLRQALLRRVDGIAADYPDEVEAWGGRKVLLKRELLREIIASLEADAGP